MVTNWSFFINVLQTVSCSRRKLTYQAENGTFSGSLEIERKSQGVLMQRTLAWISAAWICSREAKAEGQPSPSCAVGKQRLSGQHTVELLDLLSRITSSKKKKSKLTNKKEIGMKYGWASSASIYWNTIVWTWLCQFHRTHRTTQSVLHCVMCKRLTSAGPRRHWSRRLCHAAISFQEDTLQDEADPPLLGPVL